MPRPTFIICADNMVQDKDTNQLSIFNVIGKITYRKTRDGKPTPINELGMNEYPNGLGLMKVVAVWTKQPGEEGIEFEHEFRVIFGDLDDLASGEPFAFTDKISYYRFFLAIRGLPIRDGLDRFFIRSRVRRKDSENWESQDCQILVDIVEPKPLQQDSAELTEMESLPR